MVHLFIKITVSLLFFVPVHHGVGDAPKPSNGLSHRLVGDAEPPGNNRTVQAELLKVLCPSGDFLIGRCGACVHDCDIERHLGGGSLSVPQSAEHTIRLTALPFSAHTNDG